MRKKELLALALPEPTEEMIWIAKNDRCVPRKFEYVPWCGRDIEEVSYGTHMYYAARAEGGILIVSAWTRDMLAEDASEPAFTCYIDPEKQVWRTVDGGDWSEAMFDTFTHRYRIINRTINTIFEPADVYSEEGAELCRSILRSQEEKIPEMILKWQREQREKTYKRKEEKKKAYWDSRMALIPDIPEKFSEWVDKEGAGEDHFIFFKKAGSAQEAFCTRCGTTFKPNSRLLHSNGNANRWDYRRHAHEYVCPSCGKILTTKSWNKQKEIRLDNCAVLVQDANGELILRHFNVVKVFKRGDDMTNALKNRRPWDHKLYLFENVRVFADPKTLESVESYHEADLFHLNVRTWRQTSERSYRDGKYVSEAINIGCGSAFFQDTGRIARLTRIHEGMIKRCRSNKNTSVQGMLKRAGRKRYLEYLYRSGLSNLADEIISGRNWDIGDLCEEATDLKNLLGVNGQQLRLMKELNGDSDTLKLLKWLENEKARIDMDTLIYMSREGIHPHDLSLDRTGMSLQRMMNYIRKQADREGVKAKSLLQTYRDYLNMAERRGMDLHDEIVCRTPWLRELHDRYVYESEQEKNANRDAVVDEKYPHIRMDSERNAEHFAYGKDGMVIVIPQKASDITEEGRRQHHCVGAGDGYIKNMDERERFILFLRHKEKPETPYYTLEVSYDGKVYQAYGAYDRTPDKAKVDRFLDSFTRQIRKRTKREKAKGAEEETTAGGAVLCSAV